MNPFEPASLSPLPQAPVECALPYNLTWDDLIPFLPGYTDRGGVKPRAFNSYEKQGLNGGANSCILSFNYPAQEQPRSETLFIKQTADPTKAEAQRYRYLASQDVPTPHLRGVIQKGGAEVILVEFLAAIGIDFRSDSEVTALLSLLATLNAIQNPPDCFNPAPGLPQAEFDEIVRAALMEVSNDGSFPPVDASRWFDVYQIAQKASNAMPVAVNHGEFYFQQVGWAQRESSRELVLFDLETMALRPRFTDIAGILYPLAAYTGRGQAELFRVYLDRLNALNPDWLAFDEAFRELKLLRIAESCYTLPWLVSESKCTGAVDMQENLSMTMRCLWDDAKTLGIL